VSISIPLAISVQPITHARKSVGVFLYSMHQFDNCVIFDYFEVCFRRSLSFHKCFASFSQVVVSGLNFYRSLSAMKQIFRTARLSVPACYMNGTLRVCDFRCSKILTGALKENSSSTNFSRLLTSGLGILWQNSAPQRLINPKTRGCCWMFS
jgi:hypothetical protein